MPSVGVASAAGWDSREERIQLWLIPVGEYRHEPTRGKLRGNIRSRQLHKTRTVDGRCDGDARFTGDQRPLDVHLKSSAFLAEAPRHQRTAGRAEADASVFGHGLVARRVCRASSNMQAMP